MVITVKDGFMQCPFCHKKLKRIGRHERAVNCVLFCRYCKHEIEVDISEGQCHESRSR